MLSLVRLHWLPTQYKKKLYTVQPIKQRIDFKLALLTLKALNFNQPSYVLVSAAYTKEQIYICSLLTPRMLFRRTLFVTTAYLTSILSVLVLVSVHFALQHHACGMPYLRLLHQRRHC